ncbi:MAG: hypothetical protein KDE19_02745 [Caldilineaceae bacterium]|nr:hypothetical protein [Caldilineaceae bacterium]
MQKFYFRQCTATLLDRTFGLRQTFVSDILDDWLNAEQTVSEAEKATLTTYQELLVLNETIWNEQELALLCIGPIFATVHLTEPYRYNLFAGRRISAPLSTDSGEIGLSGEPDGIIATGFREPEVPFFAFTEYKRQLDPEGEPTGQTLAAMLVAQALNKNQQPVYGAYVVGSDWRFMVLTDKQYTISRDYSALSDEIFDILRILKGLKQIVMGLTA